MFSFPSFFLSPLFCFPFSSFPSPFLLFFMSFLPFLLLPTFLQFFIHVFFSLHCFRPYSFLTFSLLFVYFSFLLLFCFSSLVSLFSRFHFLLSLILPPPFIFISLFSFLFLQQCCQIPVLLMRSLSFSIVFLPKK